MGQDQSCDRHPRNLRPDGRLHQPDDAERGDHRGRAGQGRGEAGETLYSHNDFMLYNITSDAPLGQPEQQQQQQTSVICGDNKSIRFPQTTNCWLIPHPRLPRSALEARTSEPSGGWTLGPQQHHVGPRKLSTLEGGKSNQRRLQSWDRR